MCEKNYKEQDRERIMKFIRERGGEVDVECIIKESGAEKLRVYPILFEEEQEGHLVVTERESLGAAERVKFVD
ncbi:MAG: hypothetical protein ACI4C3_00485 [Bacteroides sp.]